MPSLPGGQKYTKEEDELVSSLLRGDRRRLLWLGQSEMGCDGQRSQRPSGRSPQLGIYKSTGWFGGGENSWYV